MVTCTAYFIFACKTNLYGPADRRTTELENPVELKETTVFIATAFGGTVDKNM